MAMTLEELETALKTATDKISVIDDVINGKANLVWRCSHSGLMYPADYVSQWGRKYGISLGKEVVSECLDTNYHVKPISPDKARRPEHIMFPFGFSRASVDAFFVPLEVANKNMPVLHNDDPLYETRTPILRAKQMAKKDSTLKILTGSIS